MSFGERDPKILADILESLMTAMSEEPTYKDDQIERRYLNQIRIMTHTAQFGLKKRYIKGDKIIANQEGRRPLCQDLASEVRREPWDKISEFRLIDNVRIIDTMHRARTFGDRQI